MARWPRRSTRSELRLNRRADQVRRAIAVALGNRLSDGKLDDVVVQSPERRYRIRVRHGIRDENDGRDDDAFDQHRSRRSQAALYRIGHGSAAISHRATERDADTHAAAESRFDSRHDTTARGTLDAEHAHEHGAPFIGAVVYRAQAARRVRGPAKLAQRVDDEPHEAVDAAGTRRHAVAPRLTNGANNTDANVRVRRNAHADADVSRARTCAEKIDAGFGLETLRLLAALLRVRGATGADDRERTDCDRSTPAERPRSRPHVARSRHSMSV